MSAARLHRDCVAPKDPRGPEEWGLRDRDTNPCLGIAKNPKNRIARLLDADDLARVGRALETHDAE